MEFGCRLAGARLLLIFTFFGVLRVYAHLPQACNADGKAHISLNCSASEEHTLRLVNGTNSRCGRVEVCHNGQWGTICDDSFDSLDANVICKTMGFDKYRTYYYHAYYGRGTGPIWLDNMRCSWRHTRLLQCPSLNWGRHNCKHNEDVSVCCIKTHPGLTELPVRLATPDGDPAVTPICPDRHNTNDDVPSIIGIVEVMVNGVWGRISAGGWSQEEAHLVCGMMGYPIGQTLPSEQISFGSSGSGSLNVGAPPPTINNRTYLANLECTGKEINLLGCFFSNLGPVDNPCGSQVAAVNCKCKPYEPPKNRTARLKCGPVPWKGRLEVYRNGAWGTVCDSGFDILDGNVACRQLGYGSIKTIYTQASLGFGIGPIHMASLRCNGRESELNNCSHLATPPRSCDHTDDVGVLCQVPEPICKDMPKFDVLKSPHPLAPWIKLDYVQVQMTHSSGSQYSGLVCASVITQNVGKVFCRSKVEFLSEIHSREWPRNHQGVVFSGSITCDGDEMCLSECEVNLHPVFSCPDGYADVICAVGAPDLVIDIDVLQRSLDRHWVGRTHTAFQQCAYEEGCLASDADIIFSPYEERLLLRFDSQTWNYGSADFRPDTDRSEWEWHECHNHFHSMEEFVHYDILNETTGKKIAEGHKASFCLEDSLCVRGRYEIHRGCVHYTQGISAGCADLYGIHLDCQWIDVTGIVPGNYTLRLNSNPSNRVLECDYCNNIAMCSITLRLHPYGSLGIYVNHCHVTNRKAAGPYPEESEDDVVCV